MPLAERGHDILAGECLQLSPPSKAYQHPDLAAVVEQMKSAKQEKRPIVAMIGGHLVKLGLSRFLIDLMARGFLTHLATNGAALIHDFELAQFGGTSENVSRWIQCGQFGLWQETSQLNEIIGDAARREEGIGEAIGRTLEERPAEHRELSLAAAGWRFHIPVTCHVSIGSDITHSHGNFDGAAYGKASTTDFLIFAAAIEDLEGGVFLNIGSAVTGPEVYLKALSMARNVCRPCGRELRRFTTAVFDLVDLPANFREGTPSRDVPLYYYRPWKTILVRTVADGGQSYFFRGDFRQTIPALWAALVGDNSSLSANSAANSQG